jgi:UDP-N-acetylglucosamine--N-acetylmuramyl-(pentapeptide) pyrophosphoryl-undecaprenol N-acetylglucosamine transferase
MDTATIRNKEMNSALDVAKTRRIIIAGGGTGGHIFPAIAIANAIVHEQPGTEILFIGATGKMEMEKVPQAGYAIKGITIAGFNRKSLLKNILLPFKLMTSFFQVRNIINAFKPDAVIGVGGYSSFPVLRYAQAKGIPSFIHESNSFAGKSNMLLGKKAVKIFVATDHMEKFFPKEKIMITGNPVRKAIAESTTGREEGIRFFGLDEHKRTILAVGGSLGARTINEALVSGLDELETHSLQLIWQTGKISSAVYQSAGRTHSNVWVNEFIREMEMAYAAADIIISRAGAMSVSELCVAGKPAILVPYPYAAEDHQTFNAKSLVDKKAALMVKDGEAAEKLVSALIDLSNNEPLQSELKRNIRALAVVNADEIIAKEILNHISE